MPSNKWLRVVATLFAQAGAAVVVIAAGNEFQQLSLRDLARENNGKAAVVSDAQMPFATLEVLTNGADIIVQGKLTKIETRLSKDESMIWTYLTLRSDMRFLKDTVGGRVPSEPGFPPEFTFFEPGGTVRLDGLEMTYRSNLAADPPLQVGEEVIAFLVKSEEPRGLRVQYGPYGLLRVQDQKVAAANKEFARKRHLGSSDVADLHRKVHDLVGAAPKR